ncbi:MAG: hypothetical protein SV760_06025 [Halobacteria archaeon]|nr:hypothetical protein [Halobacteria archaeon]
MARGDETRTDTRDGFDPESVEPETVEEGVEGDEDRVRCPGCDGTMLRSYFEEIHRRICYELVPGSDSDGE